MSSDVENEYFCDGITEEIINALAKIDQLKVTSRTSSFHFKNKEIPITEIANTLNVSVVLEGSARLSGKMIRITAQLIQAEEDFHFWSETWDRELENIFEIQDEISLLIADKIRENFGHFELQDHLVEKQTNNINAYEYSLMAKFHKAKWNPDDIKIAEEYYLKALQLDPKHVESIIGLARAYSFMAMTGIMPFMEAWSKSNNLVDQAFELDPNNPEIYYQKANSAFFTDCNFEASFLHASKSIQLKPNFVESQQFMSFLCTLAGNKKKAKEHIEIALGIDPLSQETLFYSAYFDYMTENYASSLKKSNEILKVNPKNIPSHSVKCLCLLKMGKYEEVIHYFDDLNVEVIDAERNGLIGLAYAMKGDTVNASKHVNNFKERAESRDGFTADSFLFMIYAAIGDKEKAFDWISSGINSKAPFLLLRYTDPVINPIKSDPRYTEFHKKLFPSASKKVVTKQKKPLLDEQTSGLYKANLLEYIKKEEPYLDPSLSLRSLADKIQLHPNQLSWLLNENIGKSFNQFVNAYRVEAFKAMSRDRKNANFTLLGMAYDCGFNSKTVFNSYFKKETGLTPKQFVKQFS